MSDTISTKTIDEWDDAIQRIAVTEHRGNAATTPEDIAQELWVYLLMNRDSLDDYHEGAVVKMLVKEARKYARSEREDFMYFSGAFIYSGEHVAALLSETTWVNDDEVIDIEGRLDVREHFAKLTPTQQQALFLKYGAGRKNLSSSQRTSVSRGLKRLTDLMNAATPPSGVELEDAALLV